MNQPTVDVAGHLRGLLRYLPIGIVVGIVVAIAVYAYQASSDTRYQATVVAQIIVAGSTETGQSGSTSTDSVTAAGPFVALAEDEQVLTAVARAARVTLTPARLASQISVTASSVPGIVDIVADGDSRAQASAIATSVVTTLDATYRSRQQSAASPAATVDARAQIDQLSAQADELANTPAPPNTPAAPNGPDTRVVDGVRIRDLAAQLARLRSTLAADQSAAVAAQRLILLAQPQSGVRPSTIPPVAIASVIGLIAMIVVTEILAALRLYRGTTVGPEWARRVARTSRVSVETPAGGADLSGATTAAVAKAGGPILLASTDSVGDVVARLSTAATHNIERRPVAVSTSGLDGTDYRLGVIVVRAGEPVRSDVARLLEWFSAWDVPARVVLVARSGNGVAPQRDADVDLIDSGRL